MFEYTDERNKNCNGSLIHSEVRICKMPCKGTKIKVYYQLWYQWETSCPRERWRETEQLLPSGKYCNSFHFMVFTWEMQFLIHLPHRNYWLPMQNPTENRKRKLFFKRVRTPLSFHTDLAPEKESQSDCQHSRGLEPGPVSCTSPISLPTTLHHQLHSVSWDLHDKQEIVPVKSA